VLSSLERLAGSYYWQKYQYEGGEGQPIGWIWGSQLTFDMHGTTIQPLSGRARSLASTDEIVSSLYRTKMEDYGRCSKQFCLTSKRLCVA
jgi:hypothetical protein